MTLCKLWLVYLVSQISQKKKKKKKKKKKGEDLINLLIKPEKYLWSFVNFTFSAKNLKIIE